MRNLHVRFEDGRDGVATILLLDLDQPHSPHHQFITTAWISPALFIPFLEIFRTFVQFI
ncbi:MAG TPA: hypothetical protein VN207_09060 [Ktedonobacteraceae bacterium]|nr:hypothetical protein [Ktedonobacteraceae bacterium]